MLRLHSMLQAVPQPTSASRLAGVAAGEAGEAAAAIRHYRRAVELAPRYAEAWCNMGVLHKQEASAVGGIGRGGATVG